MAMITVFQRTLPMGATITNYVDVRPELQPGLVLNIKIGGDEFCLHMNNLREAEKLSVIIVQAVFDEIRKRSQSPDPDSIAQGT